MLPKVAGCLVNAQVVVLRQQQRLLLQRLERVAVIQRRGARAQNVFDCLAVGRVARVTLCAAVAQNIRGAAHEGGLDVVFFEVGVGDDGFMFFCQFSGEKYVNNEKIMVSRENEGIYRFLEKI